MVYKITEKTCAVRYHDFSSGHRVVGHEGKCRFLHGHNYRAHFHCSAERLDAVGRVIDFGVIKERLCLWLEAEWDHKFLIWEEDPLYGTFRKFNSIDARIVDCDYIFGSLAAVPFNPTAENMAKYLVEEVGPAQLEDTGVTLFKVVLEETRKCSASYELETRVVRP